MKRVDFQHLARTRLRDARTLLVAKRAAGAYYLTGQAVECALKACIAKKSEKYEFPDRTRTNSSYTHDLTKLLSAAMLKQPLAADMSVQRALEVNWTVVKDWKHDCRYDGTITMVKAMEIYRAVTGRSTGVMAWIRKHW
jgi:HEPN domain-containing protein